MAAIGPRGRQATFGLPTSQRLDRDAEHLGGLSDADLEVAHIKAS
jgi:hypothetical protein